VVYVFASSAVALSRWVLPSAFANEEAADAELGRHFGESWEYVLGWPQPRNVGDEI